MPTKLNLVEEDGAHRGVLEMIFAVTDVKKKRWPIYRHRAALALKPETYERVSKGAMRVLSQLSLTGGPLSAARVGRRRRRRREASSTTSRFRTSATTSR